MILQGNRWTQRYDEYGSFGRQPFGGPHPHYGPMGAADFTNVLCLIASRRSELEKARPSATSLTELIGSAAAMITAIGAWAWYCVLCPPSVLS